MEIIRIITSILQGRRIRIRPRFSAASVNAVVYGRNTMWSRSPATLKRLRLHVKCHNSSLPVGHSRSRASVRAPLRLGLENTRRTSLLDPLMNVVALSKWTNTLAKQMNFFSLPFFFKREKIWKKDFRHSLENLDSPLELYFRIFGFRDYKLRKFPNLPQFARIFRFSLLNIFKFSQNILSLVKYKFIKYSRECSRDSRRL